MQPRSAARPAPRRAGRSARPPDPAPREGLAGTTGSAAPSGGRGEAAPAPPAQKAESRSLCHVVRRAHANARSRRATTDPCGLEVAAASDPVVVPGADVVEVPEVERPVHGPA